MSSKKGKKKNRRKHINYIFWAAMAIFVAIIAIVLIIILTNNKKPGNSSNNKGATKQVQTEAEYVFNKVSDITINLSDGKAVLNYGNDASNKDYIQYTFKLADSKEVIYQSDKLKPGEVMGDVTFKLPAGTSAGTVDVKVYIDNYDSASSVESLQGIIQEIKLTIK